MKSYIKLIFTLIILFLYSCNDKNESQKESENISSDTVKFTSMDTLQTTYLNDSLSPSIDTTNKRFFGKGKLWRVWEKLHRNCQNNNMTKGMIYLGVSNTLSLGSILRYDKENKNYLASFPIKKDSFSIEQQQMIFNEGTSSGCSYSESVKVGFDFLLKSNIVEGVDGELTTSIENAKNIESKIDSWQQDVLYTDAFRSIINRMSSNYSKDYLAAARLPDRFIIVSQIRINGFSAIINTKTNISANLKVQLEQGIIEKIGNTDASVKYSYAGEKSIKVTTIGSFIVFGILNKLE